MRFLVENEQVDGQHRHDERVEPDPQPSWSIRCSCASWVARDGHARIPGRTAAKRKRRDPRTSGCSPCAKVSPFPDGNQPNRAPERSPDDSAAQPRDRCVATPLPPPSICPSADSFNTGRVPFRFARLTHCGCQLARCAGQDPPAAYNRTGGTGALLASPRACDTPGWVAARIPERRDPRAACGRHHAAGKKSRRCDGPPTTRLA